MYIKSLVEVEWEVDESYDDLNPLRCGMAGQSRFVQNNSYSATWKIRTCSDSSANSEGQQSELPHHYTAREE